MQIARIAFGLLFAAIGVLGLFIVQQEPEMLPVAVVTLFVGLLIATARKWSVIDPEQGVIRVRYGLAVVPIYTKTHEIGHFERVDLTAAQRGKKKSQTVHPVSLRSPHKTVELLAPSSYQPARAEAERLAKSLGLPLHDRTSGHTSIRQPDELDEPLRDRLIRLNSAREVPEPPTYGRAVWSAADRGFAIDLPAPGLDLANGIALAAAWGIAGFISVVGINSIAQNPDLLPSALCFGSAALVFAGAGAGVVIARLPRMRVELDPAELRVTQALGPMMSTQTMHLDELEELFVAQPTSQIAQRRIVARSDTQTLEFGGSLDPVELEWILAMLEFSLVADAPSR